MDPHRTFVEISAAYRDELYVEIAQLRQRVEELRVALQDVQGIALNGLEVGDTEADRLFEIDRRVVEVLAG